MGRRDHQGSPKYLGRRSVAKRNRFQQKVPVDAFTNKPIYKFESDRYHLGKLLSGVIFCTIFCTHDRLFEQVLTTFMVKDSFRDALKACPKITKKKFPFLYEIKTTHGKNYGAITKINKQAFKRLMIVIARLHQAREICKHFQQVIQEDWCDAYVTDCFVCIEEHLQEIMPQDTAPPIIPPQKIILGKITGT